VCANTVTVTLAVTDGINRAVGWQVTVGWRCFHRTDFIAVHHRTQRTGYSLRQYDARYSIYVLPCDSMGDQI